MRPLKYFSSCAVAAFAAFLLAPSTRAQTSNSPSATAAPSSPESETIALNVFEVSTEKPSRYQSTDTSSGGRIRTNIMDSDASIQVITKELIQDLGSTVILDAAKYVAGVSESNAPNALDRITVRGFQTDGQTVDGFYFVGASNFEPALIERMEIVKGPNAVLSPTGTPGGTVNIVTKKPEFKSKGEVSVQTGQFDANRVTFDQTGQVGNLPLAYRVVSAAQDSTGPFDNFYRKSFLIAPSLTWRPMPKTDITLQTEYYRWESLTYSGLPLDPSVGTNDRARIWSGVDEDLGIYQTDEHRGEQRRRMNLTATTMIGDHLSVRLAGRYLTAGVTNLQINNGLNVTGGSYNPFTGLWDAGLNWTSTNGVFTAAPAAQPSRTVTRAGTWQIQDISRYDVQNDYVFDYDFAGFKSLTTAGYQYGYLHQNVVQQNVSRGTESLDALTPPAQLVYSPVNFNSNGVRSIRQYYAVERLSYFQNRLILSVGGTWLTSFGTNRNILTDLVSTAPRSVSGLNYGVVAKPVSFASLFYAHSESALPNTDFSAVASGSSPPFQTGIQSEGGFRLQFDGGKTMITASYFDIQQSNYVIPNPANLSVPPPIIPFPALFSDRHAWGWEVNLNTQITSSLSFVGNMTQYKNRDPNNVPFRSTGEKSAAIYSRYDFRKGWVRGFAVAVGVDYLGKRPGDQASGFAATSTDKNVIPRQPSFYLPPRTLTNLFLTYNRGHSTYGVSVNNLFDKDYLTTALSRTSVWPGFGRNVKASYLYRF